MVSIIGGPAKCQLRKVTGTDYHTSCLISNIHNYLGTLSGLTVFISHIMLIGIMSDITEMNCHCLFDVHFPQSCSQFSGEVTGIPIGTVCSSKTGHSNCRDAFPAQSQIIKSSGRHQKCQRGIQTAGNTKNCTAAMSVFQTFFQSHCLDRKNLIASFFSLFFIGGYKRFRRKYTFQASFFYFQIKGYHTIPLTVSSRKCGHFSSFCCQSFHIHIRINGLIPESSGFRKNRTIFADQIMASEYQIRG